MSFDKFSFWACVVLTTAFISANLWLGFKAYNAMPQAFVTYAGIVGIAALIAIFKPETRHSILALCSAFLAGIPAGS